LDEIQAKAAGLLQADQEKLIPLQYELTTFKLVRKVLDNKGANERYPHLETMIRKSKADIAAKRSDVLKRMEELYWSSTDSTAKREQVFERILNGNLSSTSARLTNEDVSAYVLADQVLNQGSDFDDTDAAVRWFMNVVGQASASTFGAGSASANLIQVTNRVARYTGAVAGVTALSAEEAQSRFESILRPN